MAKNESKKPKKMKRKEYEKELAKLEVELVKLQGWIKEKGVKVAVIFEGRDSAGKGGVIKRITRRLSPRVVRVVATPTPTEKQKTQWLFQRDIPHLPSGGEMVLFDRSWYNRAGVERVMGFCTDAEYQEFMSTVNGLELALTRTGTLLIKYLNGYHGRDSGGTISAANQRSAPSLEAQPHGFDCTIEMGRLFQSPRCHVDAHQLGPCALVRRRCECETTCSIERHLASSQSCRPQGPDTRTHQTAPSPEGRGL